MHICESVLYRSEQRSLNTRDRFQPGFCKANPLRDGFTGVIERALYLRRTSAAGRVGRLARSRSSKLPCSGGGSETFFGGAVGFLASKTEASPSSSCRTTFRSELRTCKLSP